MRDSLIEIIDECYQTAHDKGWNDNPRELGTSLLLAVSELTEAFEFYRDGESLKDITYKDGKPEGFSVEIADALIRLFHLVKQNGVDLPRALSIKMTYNKTRPYRHGDKLA